MTTPRTSFPFGNVLKKFKINSLQLAAALSLYFTLIVNFSIINKAIEISAESTLLHIAFPVWLVLSLFCMFFSIFSVFSIRCFDKIIFIALVLISSILSYANLYYGLCFKTHSAMMAAVTQATFAELYSFINYSFLFYFILSGVMPAYAICKLKIIYYPFWKNISITLIGFLIYPIFYFLITLPFFSITPNYQQILAKDGLSARLPAQIIPNNFFSNLFSYTLETFEAHKPYEKIGLDAMSLHSNHPKKNLLILVIGETARGDRLQLNGYKKNTNSYTNKLPALISFKKMSACATSTRLSVPCIFSPFDQKNFSSLRAQHQDNLLDILKRAGLNILWIDNNGGGDCQGVCKHIRLIVKNVLDGKLTSILDKNIDSIERKDSVIVLHLSGSHGPNYYEKYPTHFRKFMPDCRQKEFRLCTKTQLMNAYDNSILYTDYVIKEIITALKKQEHVWNTALIYTSDHGESIGEHHVYGHGSTPIADYPEQMNVPLLFWASIPFLNEKKLSINCLKEKAVRYAFSHDNLFHSILGLMDISTSVYSKKLDIFDDCKRRYFTNK